mmetsp:Transcript_1706/g.5047  ORF Transcript_1706/g.5047 Transcript_1706/m.5047 type:complete len:105 (-) Transcript_1706:1915-2229(-)
MGWKMAGKLGRLHWTISQRKSERLGTLRAEEHQIIKTGKMAFVQLRNVQRDWLMNSGGIFLKNRKDETHSLHTRSAVVRLDHIGEEGAYGWCVPHTCIYCQVLT